MVKEEQSLTSVITRREANSIELKSESTSKSLKEFYWTMHLHVRYRMNVIEFFKKNDKFISVY